MCGITGILASPRHGAIDRSLLVRMNDSQTHRGPDDGDVFVAEGIGLGHRRLSIIDLAGGHQPMFNEDHTVALVYNGEIYNFQELAKQLASAGHTFRTHSDTEVIVHAWEEWGEACVERFRGMFAFALWDIPRKTLFLARDRLGIKPLYYSTLADGAVIFGSELKSLLVHPDLPREIDVCAVEDFFAYGYVPDPKSIYRSVHKLAPGHTLTIRRGSAVPPPRQYWDIRFGGNEALSEAEACEDLIPRLREAVRIRMIADVPLGAFLSGGVDSSAVVALMAGESADPVDTCSISFPVAAYDESKYARMMSDRYATRHHVREVDPYDFDLVDSLATFYDEPFADSSAIPTYRVCALAREHVTVALSGDGGDELFVGYRRYRWHHYEEMLRSRMPQALRQPIFGALGALYPKLDWAPKMLRAKSTFQALARDTVGGYFRSISIAHDGHRNRMYSQKMHRDLQGYHASEVLREHFEKAPSDDHLEKVQYVDFKTYLPGDILTKVDRASMATSLEVRVPILDHKFVEWSASLPSNLKMVGREQKYLLKKALEPLVSNDILYRDKMGFAVPLGDWFRGPLRERARAAVTSDVLADTGLFDMAYTSRLMDQHASGSWDHSAVLWSLVMFESFLRQVHNSAAA
jgi:asparagine synthase (glutamine-hydrolysing)